MALKRQEFLDKLANTQHFGIRIELVDKKNNSVINFEIAKKLIPFFKTAGVTLLDLGNLNSFDHVTKKNTSIFAKEPTLISSAVLKKSGYNKEDLPKKTIKIEALRKIVKNIINNKQQKFLSKVVNFENKNSYWIKNYASFSALSNYIGTCNFDKWPENIKSYERKPISIIQKQLPDRIFIENALQFLVHKSYLDFIKCAHEAEIYVSTDLNLMCEEYSSEIWGNIRWFFCNNHCKATVYNGLPPSKTLKFGIKNTKVPYRWNELYNDNFEFLHKLFEHYEETYDYLHLQNGHTLFHYWEIPSFENDPQFGRWVPVKSDLFFEYMRSHFDNCPYFLDFNEPLFPKHELMIKRHSLLQSVILGEPEQHICQQYDLSRSINLITSKLCDTKINISDDQRKCILDSAKSNFKILLQSKISLKIIHFDEICVLLNTSLEDIMSKPEHYGMILRNMLSENKLPLKNFSKNGQPNKEKSSIVKKLFSYLKKN